MSHQVEELIERLMSDPNTRAEYLANPDDFLARAGLDEDSAALIRKLDIEPLRRGTYAGQRREAGLLSACRGGSAS